MPGHYTQAQRAGGLPTRRQGQRARRDNREGCPINQTGLPEPKFEQLLIDALAPYGYTFNEDLGFVPMDGDTVAIRERIDRIRDRMDAMEKRGSGRGAAASAPDSPPWGIIAAVAAAAYLVGTK